MKLSLQRFRLPLARPFTISRGTLTSQEAVVCQLELDGQTGLGEVTANTYYDHSLDSIEASIEKVRPLVESYRFGHPEDLWQQLCEQLSDDYFALSAIDIAAQDLFARLQGKRCYEVWGLDASSVCPSSYTIAIDTIDVMLEKLAERPGWPVYKIKLGTGDDLEIVRQLREATDAVFRVDANCGWTASQTVDKSLALAELGVEFIEQPLPADASQADQRQVYEKTALPIIADENCLVESDVQQCQGRFHGINVKLCKCGGLTPAVRMLRQARALGLQTMVGCMIESSIGISAGAQLLPLLDYADLDGAILLAQEPATGVTIDRGQIAFSDLPGCGAALKQTIDDEVVWRQQAPSAPSNVN